MAQEGVTSAHQIADCAVTLALAKLVNKNFSWIKAVNVYLATKQASIDNLHPVTLDYV